MKYLNAVSSRNVPNFCNFFEYFISEFVYTVEVLQLSEFVELKLLHLVPIL
jgi:hypothetical protein